MEMPGRLMLLDSARPVSRLSSDMRRTNAFQIPPMTAHAAPLTCSYAFACAEALTCGANAELLHRCKLTVMNVAELGASAQQKS